MTSNIKAQMLKEKIEKYFESNGFEPTHNNNELDDFNETVDLTLSKVGEIIDKCKCKAIHTTAKERMNCKNKHIEEAELKKELGIK